ncbi:hypothetical protein ABIF64_000169 [Bradyrhizobium japonicum]|uniref:Uncharacterized protein n=1 Tax=Bradyrhizobium japonicum TaxID=375 RepID=A0ABV2RM70_BRAJP|nr:hypothetical protein [Bradyrhizobium japonicum]MBR0806815.1 hypothetical protein [Bradyrhizobium japonicum]MBR0916472.1 hypothetical protein [Bradyrhizobium japonicum]UQE03259.1 hypothetical protein JEY30_00530 [Bradyrhizobium japonicum]WLB18717.1 hypothetical protein QIH95_43390 [Bradyrhizobium japonicum]
MTYEKFLEGRLQLIRDLADKADPFIRRRLIGLADRYERKMAGRSALPLPR